MARIKLAYVGGGSTRAAGTMASFVSRGEQFSGSEVTLIDLNEERLRVVETLARKMARAKVVLPAPRSPHSATASPVFRPPAMPAPSLWVAARSGRGTSPRNVSAIWVMTGLLACRRGMRKCLIARAFGTW